MYHDVYVYHYVYVIIVWLYTKTMRRLLIRNYDAVVLIYIVQINILILNL